MFTIPRVVRMLYAAIWNWTATYLSELFGSFVVRVVLDSSICDCYISTYDAFAEDCVSHKEREEAQFIAKKGKRKLKTKERIRPLLWNWDMRGACNQIECAAMMARRTRKINERRDTIDMVNLMRMKIRVCSIIRSVVGYAVATSYQWRRSGGWTRTVCRMFSGGAPNEAIL